MRRILVVDDEDDIREVAQLSLEMVGGWEVLAAGSGAEALRRAEAERPDAILLDVMMPGMDGPSTFLALQANPATRDIPVILLTAKVQSADRRRFEDLGVAGVLSKPFDPMELAGQVSAALGWT
ncbi:MAG: response regulator containing a CheY-like receiver domain and an domain [Gemmatimonadetes bacterium]|nr:response regulator containing a CheY-like receiver domain and an domain [Gemmatimonadota bacterium]